MTLVSVFQMIRLTVVLRRLLIECVLQRQVIGFLGTAYCVTLHRAGV
ncbi:hypothetical protein ACFQI7_01035 [Paenibacillus allorhizosphaerae]|nr:hypothetical protein [Paenibacillus allorhizosphaerae]